MSSKRGLPPKRRMRHDRHFVDELAGRTGEGGIGRMVSIGSIVSNQDQPRANLGDLSDLVASITKHGILEPLLVRKRHHDEGPGFELISGERRFHAALEAGVEEVPCIELSVSDQQALEIALVENLQRKDLSGFEEAEGFNTLITKYGYTHEQIAEAVGRSRVTVTESLRLLAIPPHVRDLCRHADIAAKGLLLEIAKAPDVDAMVQLVEAIAEHGYDRADVRARRQELQETERQPAADAEETPRPPRPKPYVLRFERPNSPVRVSLSFRTESEPDRGAVIAALEELLQELRTAAAEPSSH